MALRLSPPSAVAAIGPHILAIAECVPEPRRRLTLLTDVFFLLLVRPAPRTGKTGRIGARAARTAGQTTGDDYGGVGAGEAEGGRDGELEGGWESPLTILLEGNWFAALVSDAPRRTKQPVFREETVATLATTCAQVCLRVLVVPRNVSVAQGCYSSIQDI